MIEKTWTQKQILQEFSDCKALEEIIDRVTQERQQHNELVCDIRVNGEFVSEEKERQIAAMIPGELESLEIISQTHEELIVSSLKSQAELLESLKLQVIETYSSFRTGNQAMAHEHFCRLVEGCQFLAEALGLLKQSLQATPQLDLHATQWASAEAKYQKTVTEILSAYEAGDFYLGADILEYELAESLELWQKALQQCAQLLK